MVRHERVCKDQGERFPCLECDSTFSRTDSLRTHILRIHQGIGHVTCSYCTHTFTSSFNLNRHQVLCETWTKEIRDAYYSHHLQFNKQFPASSFEPPILDVTAAPSFFYRTFTKEEEELGILESCRSVERKFIGEWYDIPLYSTDFRRLDDGMWLNDEIVNVTIQWMTRTAFPEVDVHAFNTFFYYKLTKESGDGVYNYSKVERWTVRHPVDLFSKRVIFFPIHLHSHWTLVVAIPSEKRIVYYDSKGMDGKRILLHIHHYLTDEALAKKKSPIIGWTMESTLAQVPQQPNDVDCGVYMLMYIYYWLYSLQNNVPIEFPFGDANMKRIRKQMKLNLLTSARPPPPVVVND